MGIVHRQLDVIALNEGRSDIEAPQLGTRLSWPTSRTVLLTGMSFSKQPGLPRRAVAAWIPRALRQACWPSEPSAVSASPTKRVVLREGWTPIDRTGTWNHWHQLPSASLCARCFSGLDCLSASRLTGFQRIAGRPAASGKPINPKSGWARAGRVGSSVCCPSTAIWCRRINVGASRRAYLQIRPPASSPRILRLIGPSSSGVEGSKSSCIGRPELAT